MFTCPHLLVVLLFIMYERNIIKHNDIFSSVLWVRLDYIFYSTVYLMDAKSTPQMFRE